MHTHTDKCTCTHTHTLYSTRQSTQLAASRPDTVCMCPGDKVGLWRRAEGSWGWWVALCWAELWMTSIWCVCVCVCVCVVGGIWDVYMPEGVWIGLLSVDGCV